MWEFPASAMDGGPMPENRPERCDECGILATPLRMLVTAGGHWGAPWRW